MPQNPVMVGLDPTIPFQFSQEVVGSSPSMTGKC